MFIVVVVLLAVDVAMVVILSDLMALLLSLLVMLLFCYFFTTPFTPHPYRGMLFYLLWGLVWFWEVVAKSMQDPT